MGTDSENLVIHYNRPTHFPQVVRVDTEKNISMISSIGIWNKIFLNPMMDQMGQKFKVDFLLFPKWMFYQVNTFF